MGKGAAFSDRILRAGTLTFPGNASCPLCLGILFLVTTALVEKGTQLADGTLPLWELFKAEHIGEGKMRPLSWPSEFLTSCD